MAPKSSRNLRLEIGHVLFIDVVGYSKLLIEEQKEQMRRLTDIVLATPQVQESTNEQLVRLPTGDGMALVFRNNPEEPAQCALETARALRLHPEIQVRMGIHSGPVSEVTDVNERTNIAGAGINLAQRVMNCGDAGHILISQRVAEDLSEYRQWAPHLHPLGECEVKHGLKLTITNLFGDDFGNPAVPAKLAGAGAGGAGVDPSAPGLGKFFAELRRRNVYRASVIYAMASWLLIQIATQVFPFFEIPNWVVRAIIVLLLIGFPVALILAWAFEITPEGIRKTDLVPPEKSIRWKTGRHLDFVIIGILTVAIAFLLYLRFSPSHRAQGEAGAPEKSIAVLPFENYSDDRENAFFADGIQDDLLTNLARIKALKVISRTSVMKYRDTTTRNIKEIGESLGVANILEGSVRREGNQVAVNVQLIDARTDHHLWANRYNRTLADSIGLEGELASEIANALRLTLTPEEKIRVKRRPTENADAFDLYLRALPYEQGPDTLLEDYRRAEKLYTRAIALDPKFALAHAHLASTYAEIYHFHEPLATWEKKAKSEAQIALELDPNLAEAHFALGQCSYWMDSDYARALAEFARAQELAPNDSNIGVLVAAIQRRQGRWAETLAAYERIEKVDPQNPNIVRNLLITNTAMRNWEGAARSAARLRTIAPDSIVAKVQTGYIDFWWKGTTATMHTQLAQIPTDPDGVATSCRWEAAMLDGAYTEAEKILGDSPLDAIDYLNGGSTPKSFLAGCSALARGDRAAAQAQFEHARVIFEDNVREAPDSAERHANLGLLYAFLGRKEDALREGRRAVELKPESLDAFDGALMQGFLALIYARVGEKDLAFPLIERLLHTPGAVDSADYSITRSDLQRRWEWAPLREDPRFAKLFSSPTASPSR